MTRKLTKKGIEERKWAELREKVLNRDGHKCFLTGDTKSLNIHHIIPRQFKELAFDENNLITLTSYSHHWSKYSPHQNSLFFVAMFKAKRPEQYKYLMEKLGLPL